VTASNLTARAGGAVTGTLGISRAQDSLVTGTGPLPRTAGEAAESRGGGVPRGNLAGVAGRVEVPGEISSLEARGAGVQTACSPYDLRAIERAIDAFLADLDATRPAIAGLGPPGEAIPGILVAAVALGVLELERRRSGNRRDHALAFPGLPDRRLPWAPEE
jgi:hypothetical protein